MCCLEPISSEDEPGGEVNVAWATAPEKRIADADVGRDRNRQKAGAASGNRIDARRKVGGKTCNNGFERALMPTHIYSHCYRGGYLMTVSVANFYVRRILISGDI